MTSTFIAMFLSILIGFGLLFGLLFLSLFSGAINFLFTKPKIVFLKSLKGANGLAFGYVWDQTAEPARMDQIRVQLFNPFGSPTSLEITRDFEASSTDFARDLDLGDKFSEIKNAKGLERATIEITVSGSKSSVFQTIQIKGADFLKRLNESALTEFDFNNLHKEKNEGPVYKVPERSFIAPSSSTSKKVLKIATNPDFASEFATASGTAGAAGVAAVENYSISKVWIEPGCIVCNACEGIFPEVFQVTDTTCLIRPDAPLNDGLKVKEAAEACPVEVIKFTR